jgi:hypothetical protein
VDWKNWLFWGIMATLVQLLFEAASQGLHLSRMSLPYILGTMYTSNRSRAKLIGFVQHLVNGAMFSLIYVAIFHYWGGPTWWKGALVGLLQAAFVLLVVMSLLPEFHPRMANERYGPTARRQLEPPGFLATNYGTRTPVAIVVSHVIFGTVLGLFCKA